MLVLRPPVFRGSFDPRELVVDNFAGGGGASTGIESPLRPLGRHVDIAINHSATAIAMHKANHPQTHHFQENILEVDPREACAGRPVGLAWFSPDCKHFSKAKGNTPRDKNIRGLAWVVIRWAREVRPRVIFLENVEEFQTWGPLGEDGRPDPEKMGETFREWLAALVDLGYRVEHRVLVAADYGTPTTRKRLFLIARCDGAPIVWPAPTHGKGRGTAHRPAAEIIDWSLPCPSIFDRTRPLAPATLKRIAAGIQRYVIGAAEPFILPVTHQGDSRVHGIGEPLRTITGANRGELALARPFFVGAGGPAYAGKPGDVGRPLGTVVGENHRAIVEPFIVRHGHYSTITGAGLREGCGAGTFRGQQLGIPLATVCATNDKHLVAPIVTKHYGGANGHQAVGHPVTGTLGTITAQDHHAVTAAFITKYYNTSTGSSLADPLPTVTAGGGRGGGHLAEVRALLERFAAGVHGGGGQNADLFDPLHTVTAKARFGLVTIHGETYQIADIGMRMLQPHELFAAQGFPADYDICPDFNGKPMTKTAQTELAGNSVCPQVAAALVAANMGGAPDARRAA